MKYYLKRYGTHADTSDYTPDDHEREYVPTAYDDSSRHYDPSFGAMPNFELGGQSWVVNPANYHAPEVGQQDEWQGKTWRDMPGADSDNKKLNFTLFRRGLYKIEEDRKWAAKRSLSHHFRSAIIAGLVGLSGVACAEEPQKRDFRPLLPKQEDVGFREIKALPKRENTTDDENGLPTNSSEPENSLFPDFPTPSFK